MIPFSLLSVFRNIKIGKTIFAKESRQYIMKDRYEIASERIKALANPKRLQIITGLIENECNVTEIGKKSGVPQSTASQHLRILRDKGIVESRREGTKICYKVVDKCIKKIVECLKEEIK